MKTYLSILFLISFISCNLNISSNSTTTTTNTFLYDNVDIKATKLVKCLYQGEPKDLGVGLLLWNGESGKEVILYEDTLFNKPIIKNILPTNTKVCPFLYKPDYGIFHFIVLNSGDNYYEISYNNGKNNAFIPKYNFLFFVDWENFLINYAVAVRKPKENIIIDVISVDGDFLYGTEESGRKIKIRWKKQNKILIEILLIM